MSVEIFSSQIPEADQPTEGEIPFDVRFLSELGILPQSGPVEELNPAHAERPIVALDFTQDTEEDFELYKITLGDEYTRTYSGDKLDEGGPGF